jgi:superfamily I DNA and/or RNA helicase
MAERRERQQDRNPEQSGETIVDLVIADREPGLGNEVILTLIKRNRTVSLPWTRLRAGSPVLVTSQDRDNTTVHGVISARNRDTILVSVQECPDVEPLRIDSCPDEVTRKRQRAALQAALDAGGRVGQLRSILLGNRAPTFTVPIIKQPLDQLNDSQSDAVRFAMSANDIAIIHGPPGTGKTTTVVELIVQTVKQGHSVLACAPSNTAVDNMLEKLVAVGQHPVRLGHPARVDSNLREHTLDAQVAQHELTPIIKEMLREADSLHRKASRYTRAKPARGQKQALRQDAKRLQRDAKLLEEQAIKDVIEMADIVCATTTFPQDLIGDRQFDLGVIDEACQSTEPGCWIPLLRVNRLVLAGDHCQLPPTVLSQQASREGLAVSLLERLVDLYGESVTRLLNVQYRMHHKIMDFSSQQFYSSTLVAHESVTNHLLCDLDAVERTELTSDSVTYIDTAGAGWEEEVEPEGASRRNVREAELVLKKIDQLVAAGLPAADIALIAPYAAQVRYLRSQNVHDELEIDTVDGFQGREKEAVVITCVRSNGNGEIGFLADKRRMNVALTRARRKLIVVGDSATLGGHPFYADLLQYFESIDAYHTVWEEYEIE